MVRSGRVLWLAVVSVLCCAPPAAVKTALAGPQEVAEPKPEAVEEGWFEMRRAGTRIGYVHDLGKTIRHEGRAAWYSLQETHVSIGLPDADRHLSLTTETWCEADGRLIRVTRTVDRGTGKDVVAAEVKEGKVFVTCTINGQAEKSQIDIPEGKKVYATCDERIFRRWDMVPGSSHEYLVFSPSTRKLETEQVKVTGRRTVKYGGQDAETYVLSQWRTDMPDMSEEIIVSPDFKMLSASVGNIEVRRVSKEEALKEPDRKKGQP